MTGVLSKTEAADLRAALSSATASLKLPYPSPPSSASLASALFAPQSKLFHPTSTQSNGGLNEQNPADPMSTKMSAAPVHEPESKALVMGLARSLEIPLGLKLEKVSLRWSGWETITSFAGSDALPQGGFEALVTKVFGDMHAKGAEIKLSTRVTGIEDTSSGVIISAGNETFKGRTAICTFPLGVLKTLPASFFSPSLPSYLLETIQGTHVGVLEKLLLQYPSAWWPRSTEVASYTFLPTLSSTPANPSLDEIFASSTLVCSNFASNHLPGSTPTLLTYLSETPATLLLKHPAKDVAAAYHAFLKTKLGVTGAPEPLAYEMTNWLTDEFSYGATTTPSIVSESGERSPMDFKELGRPIWSGRLGFAGEHTEMEHRGSVAGAVVSGATRGRESVQASGHASVIRIEDASGFLGVLSLGPSYNGVRLSCNGHLDLDTWLERDRSLLIRADSGRGPRKLTICLTTSAEEFRSINRLWMRISYRSQVLEPSPHGLVISTRHPTV